MTAEHQYLNLLRHLLDQPERPDRTGTGTRSMFGARMEFDLAVGFPLLTTKKLPFKVIALELLWFLSGSTNAKWLERQGVEIWREWGDPTTREMGPIYGAQWRSWPEPFVTFKKDGSLLGHGTHSIDQIKGVVDSLMQDPYGRRHIVSAWNPVDIPHMALPPCHCLFQFYVEADGRLSCQLYQRSADVFLGVPFNIASYALLMTLVASAIGREPGKFIWVGGDVHLYSNHVDQAREQLSRRPRGFPELVVPRGPFTDGRQYLHEWQFADFDLRGYDPHPHIPAPVSA